MNRHLLATSLSLACALAAQNPTALASGFRHSSNPSTMTFDAARGRLLVATEFDGGTLWEWDGVAWARSNARPMARPWMMVYDGTRQRVYLFQQPINGQGQQMLEYDGHTMVNRGQAPALLAVAADTVRGRLVGIGYGQTHEWNGVSWQQVAIGSSPGATTLQVWNNLAFDAARGRTVALTWTPPAGPGVTWEWDGITWTQTPIASPPTGALVYDPGRGEVLCVRHGIAQAWNGTTWSPRPAPVDLFDSGFQQVTSDPRTGRIYRLALSNWDDGQIGSYDGTGWTVACLGPQPVRHATMPTFDIARGRIVLFGGRHPANALVPSHHEWDGIRWLDRTAVPGPAPRRDHAQVYDSLRGETVVVGGSTAQGLAADAWAWNGTSWRQLPGLLPAPRNNPAAAYDSVRDRIVLFGGRNNAGLLGDHLEWDGTTWSQIAPTTPIGPHEEGALGYDPIRQRLVFQTSGSMSGVTWEWNGTTWNSGATTGPPMFSRALPWVAARQRLEVLAQSPGMFRTSHWAYDGLSWTHTLVDQESGLFAMSVHDPARDLMFDYRSRSLVAYPNQPASVADYGTSCGGSTTRTTLSAFGVPRPGDSAFHLDLRAEATLRPAVLGFAFAQGNSPLGNGCTLLLQNAVGSAVWFTDASGFLQVPFALPNQLALRGVQFFAQGGVLDPSSPGGVALSQGLTLVIGD